MFKEVASSESALAPIALKLARLTAPTMEVRSPLNPIAAAIEESTVRPPFASMSLEHRDAATGDDTAVGLPSLKYRDDTVALERRRAADFSTMALRRPTKVCLQADASRRTFPPRMRNNFDKDQLY